MPTTNCSRCTTNVTRHMLSVLRFAALLIYSKHVNAASCRRQSSAPATPSSSRQLLQGGSGGGGGVDAAADNTPPAPARLGLRTYLGRAYQYQCDTPGGTVTANGPLSMPMEQGTPVSLVPQPDQCCLLPVEA